MYTVGKFTLKKYEISKLNCVRIVVNIGSRFQYDDIKIK